MGKISACSRPCQLWRYHSLIEYYLFGIVVVALSESSVLLHAASLYPRMGSRVQCFLFSLIELRWWDKIMDPKMDAGMSTTGFKTFEEAIESGAAPIQLTIQQLVDVFDHMLACEVWFTHEMHIFSD